MNDKHRLGTLKTNKNLEYFNFTNNLYLPYLPYLLGDGNAEANLIMKSGENN